MLSRITWGLVTIAIGFVFVIYARKLVEWFGTMATAEKYLGYGGTYTALRIIGMLAIVIGALVTTGLLNVAVLSIIRAVGF
jgi:uncharacterized protein YjeT (DUF2065 family)